MGKPPKLALSVIIPTTEEVLNDPVEKTPVLWMSAHLFSQPLKNLVEGPMNKVAKEVGMESVR